MKRSLIFFATATAVCLMGDSFLYIALPLYYRELGLTALWQVGLLLALNRLVRIPLNPWISRLYHRLPVKKGMLFAIGVATIVTIGYGFAEGLAFWCLLRMLWGISWAFLRIGGLLALVEMKGEPDHGKWVGTYNGIVRLGSFFGMAGGGLLVWLLGFRETAFIFSAFMLVSFIVILFVKAVEHSAKREAEEEIEAAPQKGELGFYIAAGFIITLLSQGIFTASFSYLMAFHYGRQMAVGGVAVDIAAIAGAILAIRWLWEPLVAIAAGKASDKAGAKKNGVLAVTVVTAGAGLILLAEAPLVLWIGSAIVYMLGFSWLMTTMDVRAASVNKAVAHSFIGTYTMWSDIGSAIGPLIVYIAFSFDGGIIGVFFSSAALLVWLGIRWHYQDRRYRSFSV